MSAVILFIRISTNGELLCCPAQNNPHRTKSTARIILLGRREFHSFLKILTFER
jgi:hypothetical protein